VLQFDNILFQDEAGSQELGKHPDVYWHIVTMLTGVPDEEGATAIRFRYSYELACDLPHLWKEVLQLQSRQEPE